MSGADVLTDGNCPICDETALEIYEEWPPMNISVAGASEVCVGVDRATADHWVVVHE